MDPGDDQGSSNTFVGAGYAMTNGVVDMWITDDGACLYQLFSLDGTIGIYRVNGQSLEFVEEESGNLPDTNTQGIVAI
ncbi:hypothetical protein [Flagellimonas sp. CMM7]|uniref:hypothetical protein n=1 Tax=Flagellimonas sp. CMM7 TaxID=2654676 RepID=UPI0013D6CF41|nr:hypothetical protein [Flagellimonas sp. CMM7]UII79051.1 hypothetical protein LV704_15495 [Flagellimonas sp. CMM7]